MIVREIVIADRNGRPVPQPVGLWKGSTIWEGLPVVGRTATERDIAPCWSQHPFVTLCVRGHGGWQVRSGPRTYNSPLRPGNLAIQPRNFEVDGGCVDGSASEIIGMQLREDLLVSLLHENAVDFDVKLEFETNDDLLKSLLLATREELMAGCPNGALYAQGLSMAIVGRLQARYGCARRRESSSSLTSMQLSRVVDYMNARLDQNISVSELAVLAGLSPAQFNRRFRASTQRSPYKYLQEKRIQHALHLINRGEPISQVALSVGMASQSHFTETFRKVVGTTPARLRGR
jgi:AraC family transcriptional regulator